MYKGLLLLTLALCPILFFAQESEEVLTIDTVKYSVGIMGNYEYNSYTYSFDWKGDYYDNETLPGFSVGAAIKFHTKKNFQIEAGIMYAQQRFKYKIDQSTVELYPSTGVMEYTIQQLSYIRIPVEIGSNYKFNDWFGLMYQFGVCPQILINEHEQIFYDNHVEKRQTEYYYNTFQIIGMFSVGPKFKVLENTELFLTPYLGKAFFSINEDVIKLGQTTFGAQIGAYHTF